MVYTAVNIIYVILSSVLNIIFRTSWIKMTSGRESSCEQLKTDFLAVTSIRWQVKVLQPKLLPLKVGLNLKRAGSLS